MRRPVLAILVGIAAGLGAVVFEKLLDAALHYFIYLPTGYVEPVPGGLPPELGLGHTWPLLFIPTVGGLVVGLIIRFFAPEAAGHGTDAMIEAFHHRGGRIRKIVPVVKTIASALTIGTGGSAGKEGPIAQVGAGFGSALAGLLKLKPRDRRILVLAGAAAGIGAIFHAPLGAALFAPEVLYRDMEIESDAVLSCLISSIVAHAVFSQVYGRGALFFPGPVDFSMPVELLPYAIFGAVCAVLGYVYIKVFYGMRDVFFNRLRLPMEVRTALGGFMVGVIALVYPAIIAGGYGWVQVALEGKLLWGTMLLLALLKILATSCTISSGGSGGVFGPSVFIGAMLGGAFGYLGHALAPTWVVNPGAFALVGMGAFFAGVAKVPLAAIIMVCEMSASYTLLVPLMVSSTVAYLLLGKTSLYEKQVLNRIASPAHLTEMARKLLDGVRVTDAVRERPVWMVPESTTLSDLVPLVTKSEEAYFPVVNEAGRLTGILSVNDLRAVLLEESASCLINAKDVATPQVVRVFGSDTLGQALDKMASLNVDALPVVAEDAPERVTAMITKRDIVSCYYDRACVI